MILGNKEIKKLLKKKKVIITNLKESQIGPASVDLTLSKDFKINGKSIKKDTILLKPNQFILGLTKERIQLPKKIAGILTGRSSFARLGLQIHSTASFIQPGINNREVLELKNLSNKSIKLKAGEKICQLILLKVKGANLYDGKYKNQTRIL